jgi:hypothetical protein
MAVHTYIVNPLAVVPSSSTSDVLWQATGTADGLPFSFTFWQSQAAGKTLAQIQTYAKSIIDAQVFPIIPTPSGTLASFSGGTFTL